MQAAKRLGTHDTVLRFADGYQTKAAERGNFSAGERQLLTFTLPSGRGVSPLVPHERSRNYWIGCVTQD